MVDIAWKFLEFLIVFLVSYILSYTVSIRKIKKFDRKKVPINVNYLMVKYKLDIVKYGYKNVYKFLILCDSFIIAFLFAITSFINNIYIRLIVCFILVFPLFVGVYHLIYLYYRKKDE